MQIVGEVGSVCERNAFFRSFSRLTLVSFSSFSRRILFILFGIFAWTFYNVVFGACTEILHFFSARMFLRFIFILFLFYFSITRSLVVLCVIQIAFFSLHSELFTSSFNLLVFGLVISDANTMKEIKSNEKENSPAQTLK